MKSEKWSDLKGQIYLGDDTFVIAMQKKIGKEKDDWNIPQKQKRLIPPSLAKIARQETGRNAAIIAAYATGAYSQREISEYFELHPSTVGVVVRKHKNSWFATWPLRIPNSKNLLLSAKFQSDKFWVILNSYTFTDFLYC